MPGTRSAVPGPGGAVCRPAVFSVGGMNMTTGQSGANNAQTHAAEVRRMLKEVMERARAGIGSGGDPKAEAHFETSAEVLAGFVKAYDDYGKGDEAAWK